ncbi:MAG TPA: group III truncated hemoglobin [Mycobacteriales bacterium]
MAQDIASRSDVLALLEGFYTSAFADPLIGPIFTDVAQMDLASHLPNIADFWEVALLHTGSYRRNAFLVHRDLHDRYPLTPDHFDRWLELWRAAIDGRYAGPVAEHAKVQGARMAASMARRLSSRGAPQPVR